MSTEVRDELMIGDFFVASRSACFCEFAVPSPALRLTPRKLTSDPHLAIGNNATTIKIDERKLRLARRPLDPGIVAMRHLLGDQLREKVAMRPALRGSANSVLGMKTPYRGKVQTHEKCVEVDIEFMRPHGARCASPRR